MDVCSKLDALLQIAEELGLPIRREYLGGEGGGLCILKGTRVLFVDLSADHETRYERTLSGLVQLPELETRYIPPEIRIDLERRKGSAQPGHVAP